MSDKHVRVLRDIVRQRVRKLREHSARPGESSDRASSRRRDLERLSARARTRLVAAEVRRRAARDRA
jgi:hypothetical protein